MGGQESGAGSSSPFSLAIHQAHPARRVDEEAIARVVARALEGEGFRVADLSIVLTDHAAVRRLHRDWLDKDHDTDVLSFGLDEEAVSRHEVDGEVYVDLDTAAERAPEFASTPEEEVLRYVVHGVLHLCGYNDRTDAERAQMRRLENTYLESVKKGE